MAASELYSALVSAAKQTGITEWAIFISALVYVVLAAFENIWCWFFGIISSALSVYLCFSGKLFLESGLQVFYIIIGVYGWYQWLFGSSMKSELKIISFDFKKNTMLVVLGCLLWIPFGYFAHRYSTQAMPYLDGFITAFSIIATWMTAKKIIENWLFWIVIDGLAILLYSSRGFYLIALLYIIYTILAFAGYIQWRKNKTGYTA